MKRNAQDDVRLAAAIFGKDSAEARAFAEKGDTMTTQHTPGPWRAGKWGTDWTILQSDRPQHVIAKTFSLDDANLIAEAPALKAQRDGLLEALEDMVITFSSQEFTGNMAKNSLSLARAAIKAAKGEA